MNYFLLVSNDSKVTFESLQCLGPKKYSEITNIPVSNKPHEVANIHNKAEALKDFYRNEFQYENVSHFLLFQPAKEKVPSKVYCVKQLF